MKPKSLSASAVKAFSTCPARAIAESHHRMGKGGSAANLGTAVHFALEEWVKGGHHVDETSGFNILEKQFEAGYRKLFKMDDDRYEEGVDMLRDWHERNHPWPDGRKVISTEKKDNFKLQTSIGALKFNYIWDRCDMLPSGDLDVVDYKTISRPLNHDKMKLDIQVRSYALAAAIQFKEHDYDRIWVTLDMLRHGDPISVSFTREENKQTWDYLHTVAEDVIDIDINNPPENVNGLCRFCVRKSVCKTLEKYATMGTTASLGTLDEVIDRRAMLYNAQKGLQSALDELDEEIIEAAEEEGTLEFESAAYRAMVKARRRRYVDSDMVKRVVPEEVWDDYGGTKLNLSDFDKMLEDDRLDQETKGKIEQLVDVKLSSPFIITEPLVDFD